LRRPLGVGAVMPSGPKLARAMVAALAPAKGEVVVELGPGTGAFTEQLIAEGVAPQNLILIELDTHFASFLRRRYPAATVVEESAANLPQVLAALQHAKVPRILSGLPLRSMNAQKREAITRAMAAALAPGGVMAQFSYFHVPPLPKALADRLGLTGRRAEFVLANVPPAVVWRYTRT
jgi:phosphatidylethanolamine/phosphatidyl-N-methylethanolamine N-methyltransferase